MRETNSNGMIQVYMPRSMDDATNKLAKLGLSAAENNWERAAILATWVRADGRGGRPAKNRTNIRPVNAKASVREFATKGVYGFQSRDSISAWLKAWALSGLPSPEPGEKYSLPHMDFPDVTKLYSGKDDDEPSPDTASEDTDESGEDDYAEEESEGQNGGSPTPQPRPRPDPARSMLDDFLRILDRMDPNAVIHGQPADRRELLIKTLESWLESLKESDGLD